MKVLVHGGTPWLEERLASPGSSYPPVSLEEGPPYLPGTGVVANLVLAGTAVLTLDQMDVLDMVPLPVPGPVPQFIASRAWDAIASGAAVALSGCSSCREEVLGLALEAVRLRPPSSPGGLPRGQAPGGMPPRRPLHEGPRPVRPKRRRGPAPGPRPHRPHRVLRGGPGGHEGRRPDRVPVKPRPLQGGGGDPDGDGGDVRVRRLSTGDLVAERRRPSYREEEEGDAAWEATDDTDAMRAYEACIRSLLGDA